MASIDVELQDGLKVGETLHKKIRLRELTIGDELKVHAEAEKVVATPTGYHLVSSPSLVTFLTLLRQADLVNDPGVFITEEQLKKLSRTDFDLLIDASTKLEKASLEAAENRGRDDSATETP